MRKVVVLMLALLLIVPSVLSETKVVFSDFSNDELLELQVRLKQELIDRELFETSLMYPGAYKVGEDIKPGRVLFTVVTPDDGVIVAYFENYEQYTNAESGGGIRASGGREIYADKDSPIQLVLKDGQVIKTFHGIINVEFVEEPSWSP